MDNWTVSDVTGYAGVIGHIGSGKVSSVRRSVSCLSRFELRMRAILLLCQSVGHISEVLKYQMNKNLCLLLFQYFHA